MHTHMTEMPTIQKNLSNCATKFIENIFFPKRFHYTTEVYQFGIQKTKNNQNPSTDDRVKASQVQGFFW